MCMFCAAIPVAAATGVSLNRKQIKVKRAHLEAGAEDAAAEPMASAEPRQDKPIMKITGGVILLLMVGSITYHTMTNLPY